MEIPIDRTYCQPFELKRETNSFRGELCLVYMSLTELKPYAKFLLHPQELAYFSTLSFERRQLSYLLGRFAAKLAVIRYGVQASFTEILIDYGVFHYPLIDVSNKDSIQVSYSHSGELCIGLAFPSAHPMGIDLEAIDADKIDVIETQLTQEEKNLILSLPSSKENLSTLLWTSKEALSKVLRTGLTTPFEIFAVKNCKQENDHWQGEFKNFTQYQVLTFSLTKFMCSIVYPKRTQMQLNISAIQHWLTGQNNS